MISRRQNELAVEEDKQSAVGPAESLGLDDDGWAEAEVPGEISCVDGILAGVPTVVASLWSVEDQVTADFFVQFYRNLKQGFDVAGALQATQIESLEQGSSPRVWAAFETIGGGVDESP